MVQVKGMRAEVQRLSSDFTGRVKYSTSCPSAMDSPSAARRAIPTRRGPDGASKGRESARGEGMAGPTFRCLFAYMEDRRWQPPCQAGPLGWQISYGRALVFGTTAPPSILGMPKCPPRWESSTGLMDPETTMKLTSFDLATRIAMLLIALFSRRIQRTVTPGLPSLSWLFTTSFQPARWYSSFTELRAAGSYVQGPG